MLPQLSIGMQCYPFRFVYPRNLSIFKREFQTQLYLQVLYNPLLFIYLLFRQILILCRTISQELTIMSPPNFLDILNNV